MYAHSHDAHTQCAHTRIHTHTHTHSYTHTYTHTRTHTHTCLCKCSASDPFTTLNVSSCCSVSWCTDASEPSWVSRVSFSSCRLSSSDFKLRSDSIPSGVSLQTECDQGILTSSKTFGFPSGLNLLKAGPG